MQLGLLRDLLHLHELVIGNLAFISDRHVLDKMTKHGHEKAPLLERSRVPGYKLPLPNNKLLALGRKVLPTAVVWRAGEKTTSQFAVMENLGSGPR